MLIYEYKLDGNQKQFAAIEEAIRVVQFIRNKCIRLWMDGDRINKNDLQTSCAVLAKAFPFARRLNSQARQASADRAWFAISCFYENCREHKPGKKGYPQFQHNNRSVEYKATGWKLDDAGRHITFTDGCGIGRLRLVGSSKQKIETFPPMSSSGCALSAVQMATLLSSVSRLSAKSSTFHLATVRY